MTTDALHETSAHQLPELERMAKAHFRRLDVEAREEALQSTRALAWKHWLLAGPRHIVGSRAPAG
jgi:hypothetical protein